MTNAGLVVNIAFTSILIVVPLCAQYPQMEFPMHPGDWWHYTEGPGIFDDSRVLNDTILPNGLKYSTFSGGLTSGSYRKDGPRICQLAGATEQLVFDFSRKPGDTLRTYLFASDTMLIVVRDQGLWHCLGTLRFQMRYQHVSSGAFVGLIRRE